MDTHLVGAEVFHADGEGGPTYGQMDTLKLTAVFLVLRKRPTINTLVLVIPQCWLQVGLLPNRPYVSTRLDGVIPLYPYNC
jgi:hypothetical protein